MPSYLAVALDRGRSVFKIDTFKHGVFAVLFLYIKNGVFDVELALCFFNTAGTGAAGHMLVGVISAACFKHRAGINIS